MAEVKIVWSEEALKDIEEIITVFHGSKLLE